MKWVIKDIESNKIIAESKKKSRMDEVWAKIPNKSKYKLLRVK